MYCLFEMGRQNHSVLPNITLGTWWKNKGNHIKSLGIYSLFMNWNTTEGHLRYRIIVAIARSDRWFILESFPGAKKKISPGKQANMRLYQKMNFVNIITK